MWSFPLLCHVCDTDAKLYLKVDLVPNLYSSTFYVAVNWSYFKNKITIQGRNLEQISSYWNTWLQTVKARPSPQETERRLWHILHIVISDHIITSAKKVVFLSFLFSSAVVYFTCLFYSRITEKRPDGLARNLVEGSGAGQGKVNYILVGIQDFCVSLSGMTQESWWKRNQA